MAEIRININKKSFVSFILCFIMLFSILAPTVNAATSMNEEELQLQREMQKREEELKAYEEKNHITGDVIDFSSIDFSKTNSVTSKTLSSQGDSDVGSYQIVREGKEYIITLENVIAKKIILPRDDADKDGKQVMDEEGKTYNVPAYTGKPRENHITIILKGNNIITGYGMEGYPVKGIKIEGSGNLTIHAFSQPVVQKVNTQKGDTWVKSVELPYYTKAGISVETGDRTYENKDKEF